MAESSAWALMLVVLTMAGSLIGIKCIDDKCAACTAVAVELESGLLNERPRNHLDMRHRLDSKGQRRGKVIDYRVSELRVVELLDGLCDKMQDYTLEKKDSSGQVWIKVDDWDNLTARGESVSNCYYVTEMASWPLDKQEARAYSKDISSYCGRLLEETEDELAELIKKGFVQVGDVNKVLCQDLSRHCSKRSDSSLADNDDDEINSEL